METFSNLETAIDKYRGSTVAALKCSTVGSQNRDYTNMVAVKAQPVRCTWTSQLKAAGGSAPRVASLGSIGLLCTSKTYLGSIYHTGVD